MVGIQRQVFQTVSESLSHSFFRLKYLFSVQWSALIDVHAAAALPIEEGNCLVLDLSLVIPVKMRIHIHYPTVTILSAIRNNFSRYNIQAKLLSCMTKTDQGWDVNKNIVRNLSGRIPMDDITQQFSQHTACFVAIESVQTEQRSMGRSVWIDLSAFPTSVKHGLDF